MEKLFLLNSNILPDFYECEYGQYYEAAMFQDETFKNFDPEIIYIHISNENLKSLNNFDQTSEERAKDEFIKLESIWQKLSQTFECEIIQDNFEPPSFKSFGNFDVSSKSSITRTINILNEMLYKQATEKNYLHISNKKIKSMLNFNYKYNFEDMLSESLSWYHFQSMNSKNKLYEFSKQKILNYYQK